jgi:uncharacterized protein YodC (DUF2158 family)
MARKFEVGDRVQHVVGGPLGTVHAVHENGGYEIAWDGDPYPFPADRADEMLTGRGGGLLDRKDLSTGTELKPPGTP